MASSFYIIGKRELERHAKQKINNNDSTVNVIELTTSSLCNITIAKFTCYEDQYRNWMNWDFNRNLVLNDDKKSENELTHFLLLFFSCFSSSSASSDVVLSFQHL